MKIYIKIHVFFTNGRLGAVAEKGQKILSMPTNQCHSSAGTESQVPNTAMVVNNNLLGILNHGQDT